MKSLMTTAVAGCLLLPFTITGAVEVTPCDPADPNFVCGQHNPEDLVHLPGSQWVVSTSLNIDFSTLRVRGPGSMHAIDIHTRKAQLLFPGPHSSADWDRKTYPECSGPPQPFTSHGLDVKPLGGQTFRLYVVNHGARESVEIVDVAATANGLRATWRGCVKVPPELGIWPNAVAPLPTEGFVLSGNNLAVWRPGHGWKKVQPFHGVSPGGKMTADLGFANGVEVSRDGRWIFLADTARCTVSRFPVHGDSEPQVLKLDFSPGYFWPDNLHWGEDGELYLSGPYSTKRDLPGDCYLHAVCDEIGIGIARIDTTNLTAQIIYRNPGMAGRFGAATTALRIGHRFWIGTSVGDRIAIVSPAP